MIWFMTHWRTVLALLLVVAISGLLLTTSYYRNTTHSVEKELDAAVQQQKSAEAIATNIIATVQLVNDIAVVTQGDKQRAISSSENRVVIIQKSVKGDKCAAQPVPAAAADQLRQHRNQIAAGTTITDSGKPER